MTVRKVIPKVIVKLNSPHKEAELFIRFLNHPQFRSHRNLIFRAFPSLAKECSGSKNERQTVKRFVRSFYREHQAEIQRITKQKKAELQRRIPTGLKALSKAMEYQWKKPTTYTAISTILPFCPFENEKFYFSILGEIHSTMKWNVVQIAIHEISHFIFFDYLKEIERSRRITVSRDVQYYLKESLTSCLFNEKPLKRVLGIKWEKGNNDLHSLQIKYGRTTQGIVDFIRHQYRSSLKERQPFKDFLADLVVMFQRSAPAFSKKWALWNQHGMTLNSDPKLRAKYGVPVRLSSRRMRSSTSFRRH